MQTESQLTHRQIAMEPCKASQPLIDLPTSSAVSAFFGDSTNARIGDHAIKVAKDDNIPVINNAQGGSLASYALMSMDGSPVDVKFNVDTIPAKGQNVFVEGELVYGENVNPFILH